MSSCNKGVCKVYEIRENNPKFSLFACQIMNFINPLFRNSISNEFYIFFFTQTNLTNMSVAHQTSAAFKKNALEISLTKSVFHRIE